MKTAKDTVINLKNFGNFGGISEYYLEVVKASMAEQAEISFKAGIKEVVNYIVIRMPSDWWLVNTKGWQAKIKEWEK